MISYFKVQGSSMEPFAREGDFVIVFKKPFANFKAGDAVVLREQGKLLLKRIQKTEQGRYWVEGDKKEQSRDSRHFAWVAAPSLEGKAWKVIHRKVS